VQTEQAKIAASQEKAQLDAQTKMAVAAIGAEVDREQINADNANAEKDRMVRLGIAAMNSGAS
jgi:hypothetical protein